MNVWISPPFACTLFAALTPAELGRPHGERERVVFRSRSGLRVHHLATETAGALLLPEDAHREGM